jgi:hypothetical protein
MADWGGSCGWFPQKIQVALSILGSSRVIRVYGITEPSAGAKQMRYMMLIYTKEGNLESVSADEADRVRQGHVHVITETRKHGMLVVVNPLARTSNATTVRVANGKVMVTDGPFAETKEQLAGYYVLDCKDLDEAIAWAAQIPTSCGGSPGSIEIRPLQEIPGVPESILRSNSAVAAV